MPVKSTIFTALAICLALSAAEAQARRIAPMPPSSAFQGLWVAEKDAAKRQALCEGLYLRPSERPATMAYVSLSAHSLYVHTPTHQARYDGANRYRPWQKNTATQLQGVLYPAHDDFKRGAAQSHTQPLNLNWRIATDSHLVAKGFKPKHYYRCPSRPQPEDSHAPATDA